MADHRARELGGRDKGKAKTCELEDGPSSFPDFSSACGPVSFAPDGGIDDGPEQMQTDEEEEEEESRDPLMLFGSGIMMMILSKLDARSVALTRLVSRDWLAVASSDKIWAPKEKEDLLQFYREMEALWCRQWRDCSRVLKSKLGLRRKNHDL